MIDEDLAILPIGSLDGLRGCSLEAGLLLGAVPVQVLTVDGDLLSGFVRGRGYAVDTWHTLRPLYGIGLNQTHGQAHGVLDAVNRLGDVGVGQLSFGHVLTLDVGAVQV